MIDYENKQLVDTWNIEDVRMTVDDWAEHGTKIVPALTEDEMFDVLVYIDEHFDACCGVNWDVIEEALDKLYGDREVFAK